MFSLVASLESLISGKRTFLSYWSMMFCSTCARSGRPKRIPGFGIRGVYTARCRSRPADFWHEVAAVRADLGRSHRHLPSDLCTMYGGVWVSGGPWR